MFPSLTNLTCLDLKTPDRYSLTALPSHARTFTVVLGAVASLFAFQDFEQQYARTLRNLSLDLCFVVHHTDFDSLKSLTNLRIHEPNDLYYVAMTSVKFSRKCSFLRG